MRKTTRRIPQRLRLWLLRERVPRPQLVLVRPRPQQRAPNSSVAMTACPLWDTVGASAFAAINPMPLVTWRLLLRTVLGSVRQICACPLYLQSLRRESLSTPRRSGSELCGSHLLSF